MKQRFFIALAMTLIVAFALPPRIFAAEKVTLYTSVDDPYARPLVRRFEQKTGITVTLVTDSESTKTAGLVERLIAEKANPQCDVYWGNEPFHTINLAEEGVLAPYRSAVAKDVPDRWRDKNDLYVSTGLRARMIAISTRPENASLVSRIKRMQDLTDPSLKGKIGICNPAFGTASGHFAAMMIVWGEQKYQQYLQGLKANDVKLLGGNTVVAEQVDAGTLIVGPTDNEDINNGNSEGMKLDGVVPDQGPQDIGTLLIPTTIALVKGAPNTENAKKLIDFLLDPAIEKELIDGRYLAYSVRDSEKKVKAMDVDYVKVAHEMKRAIELALNVLQSR